MVVVRRCEDRNALAEFLFTICVDDLKPKLPLQHLTPEFLAAAIASWDIVEFFDQGKKIIIGAAAREPNGYMHIYIDSCRRVSWAPHTSLQAALDIFLSNYDKLYAAIPTANRATINMVRKLGFVYTNAAGGFAFHVLTAQTRREAYTQSGRRFSLQSLRKQTKTLTEVTCPGKLCRARLEISACVTQFVPVWRARLRLM